MRIAIIALGSRGDVQPYVALGEGLVKAGHFVRLLTHQDFGELIRLHGLEFWPLEGKVQDIAQSEEMRAMIGKGKFLAVLSLMSKEAQSGALHLAEVGLAAGQGMDLLLAGYGGLFIGFSLAEKLKIPVLQAYLIPFTPTRAYPSFMFPELPGLLGGAFNRVSYQLTRQVMWQGFRSADRAARQKVLDLPAAPMKGLFQAESTRGLPLLYGYSPNVIPPPPDWDANTHVTGYWFLDSAEDWAPPADLHAFLDDGPPPVYIGFGSMSSRNPEETTEMILQALAKSGQRGILHTGWTGMQKADFPDSVFMIDAAPYAWLFPRMAAVAHHGGAGTTSYGLWAGVPSIVIPFFADQPFWGRRVAGLGVGPNPIPRKKLTADSLAQAIRCVVTDQEMRQRSAALGEKIRAEDGVRCAVEIIQQLEKPGIA